MKSEIIYWSNRGLTIFHSKYILPLVSGKILNAGCGPNNELDHYLYFEKNYDVTSCDIDSNFLKNRKNESVTSLFEYLPFMLLSGVRDNYADVSKQYYSHMTKYGLGNTISSFNRIFK